MAEVTKRMKVTYKVKNEEGKEVEYAVVRPNPKLVEEGSKVRTRAFRQAIDNDAIVRARVEVIAR